MTTQATAAASSARRYLIVAIAMLVLALGLGALYYYISRPPTLGGASGTRDPNFLFSIYGFQGDLLRRPSSVAVDSLGNIHVADTGKRRIVEFDSNGNFITTYGQFGHGPLQLWAPIGVAVAGDGRSYVLDKTAKKIVIFDAQRKAYKEITFQEFPLSVTVANGNLFVTTDSGVLIGDLDGNLQTGYISHGKNPGQFDKPGGVAVGADGTIYVADSFNYRVQALGSNGKVKWVYGGPLPPGKAIQYQGADRKFGFPASIALDDSGHLYVVDGTNSELVVLSDAGSFLRTMGDVGHDDGTFYYPDGIAFGGGRLVVADKFNDRIEVFSVPSFGVLSNWKSYAPYALLLVFLPLLFLLIPRGRTFVATPEFMAALAAGEHGGDVAEALKKIQVPAELSVAVPGLAGDAASKASWVGRVADPARVAELVAKYGITEQQAESLSIAAKARGRKALLVETDVMKQAAADLQIPALTYEDLADAFSDAGPPAGSEGTPGA